MLFGFQKKRLGRRSVELRYVRHSSRLPEGRQAGLDRIPSLPKRVRGAFGAPKYLNVLSRARSNLPCFENLAQNRGVIGQKVNNHHVQ